ncbi:MAG TPA: diacylglycerol kinase family protein [Tepidisphaeraceae bacterium]|nr:diacylglycerol kinase family protein [Tepidisphaeraceae bacterium]
MRALVLCNFAAGMGLTAQIEHIEQAFRASGLAAEVRAVRGDELAASARMAAQSGVDAVVAAGGDGTISAVAGALAGTSMPMGVLPLGTLNHFAKDLGLPLELERAVRVIAAGRVRPVDVGEVNGRCFVNNSSIGLYPQIVTRRNEQCQRLGRGKWLAMGLAIIAMFHRYPVVRVVLETGQRAFHRTTPFVFIGNNRYDISLLSLGSRHRLDGGELSVYFANRPGRFGLLALMARALFGRLNQAKDFEVLSLKTMRIDTHKSSLRVACDGEVLRLQPPLNYRIRPGALNVYAPVG